jgi:malonate-semialdehyde dehydrogenase (acetylating)/methylmalonate-semialdehyde dehydrogenase
MKELKNLVGGRYVEASGEPCQVINPADGKTVVAEMRYSTPADVAAAIKAASEAFVEWSAMPVVRRCRILFRVKEALEERMDELSEALVRENGKLMAEAQGEVRRGIEVVEFAAGMPSLSKGDFIENIAGKVDGYVYREPLGVVAGACPFNFPAMIPMWMFPIAIACGNTFILKPSDRCPVSGALIADIFKEGGLPDGVLNVVHGARETFETLIKAPEVAAISFVGSSRVAESVWKLAAENHKRVQALGGAKNYIVVMPDADPEETTKAILGSAYGCAGQRCMASSILAIVKGAEPILERVIEGAKKVKLGSGLEASTAMGPVISDESKKRIEGYIALGVEEGAKLVLDGRGAEAEGLPGGHFVGATILDEVKPDMRVAQEEIFGPVLSVMRFDTLDDAIEAANSSLYGNGSSIFTSSGGAAREFRTRIECGMIGINAGVPAPMAFFPFGGFKKSIFADLRVQAQDGIDFYTRKKALIERWFGSGPTGSVWSTK